MKKIYSDDNLIMVGHVRNLLELNNISCHLRNTNLMSGIGELPINECWPEVWIDNEMDFNLAESLIKKMYINKNQNNDWKCQCGETIEGQFDTCWSCGVDRMP